MKFDTGHFYPYFFKTTQKYWALYT